MTQIKDTSKEFSNFRREKKMTWEGVSTEWMTMVISVGPPVGTGETSRTLDFLPTLKSSHGNMLRNGDENSVRTVWGSQKSLRVSAWQWGGQGNGRLGHTFC